MIPGPVELSPAVLAAAASPPPGHTVPRLVASFGAALDMMRELWAAPPGSQPFVIAGAGTLAMDMAAANLIAPGDRALLLDTGYFSARMAAILRRLGAELTIVEAPAGDAPALEPVEEALASAPGGGFKALFATHVDTSTGVRLDPGPLALLARRHGLLSIFDGVCAAAGERFPMAEWDADVYFTGSQKALGLPPGLALMVASERALATRAARRTPMPGLYLDWEQWQPIMRAYEERRPSYFSTPATSLVLALEVGLSEILEAGLEQRLALHQRAATALRAAWEALDLAPVPARPELAANTLSALRYPPGVDGSLVQRIQAQGVTVAGGLHPAIKDSYFRVGHMGWVVTQPELLRRTVEAIATALAAGGRPDQRAAALAAVDAQLAQPA